MTRDEQGKARALRAVASATADAVGCGASPEEVLRAQQLGAGMAWLNSEPPDAEPTKVSRTLGETRAAYDRLKRSNPGENQTWYADQLGISTRQLLNVRKFNPNG